MPAHKIPLMERLRTHSDSIGGCIVWSGGRKGKYGAICISKVSMLVHRVAYEAAKGPIPKGLVVDHLCRNTLCINPVHLEAVTPLENQLRGKAHTKAACKNGHIFDEANTRWRGNKRECRACSKERWRIKHWGHR